LLIVEDDPALREVWQVLFTHRGWEVVAVGTLAEGLAALDTPPDYLILDLMLPDGSGEAILQRIRDTGLSTRVAVTTGSDENEQLDAAGELGPAALLRKPVNVADVWRSTMDHPVVAAAGHA